MKKYLFLISIIFTCHAFAQETVKRSNDLTNSITERFTVLKSDKKVRHGDYEAQEEGNVVAKGKYDNGKRVGKWEFFDRKGKSVQTYDYDAQKVIWTDTSEIKTLKYYMLTSIKDTDVMTVPVKIGGLHYSLLPLFFNQRDLSMTMRNDFDRSERIDCTHILTVNAEGRIVKHEVLANADGKEKLYVLDDTKLYDDDIKQFVPATLNGQPVAAKVTMKTVSTFSSSMITRRF